METNKKYYYLGKLDALINVLDEDKEFVLGYVVYTPNFMMHNIFCKECFYGYIGWNKDDRHDQMRGRSCTKNVPSDNLLHKGLLLTRIDLTKRKLYL